MKYFCRYMLLIRLSGSQLGKWEVCNCVFSCAVLSNEHSVYHGDTMLYGLVLLHVGVMLFVSCFWLSGRTGDKEISVINIFAILASLAEEWRTKIAYEISFARKASNQLLFLHQGVVEEKSVPEILDNPRSERLQQFLSNELKWQTLK